MKRAIISGGGNYFANPKTKIPFIPSGSKLLDLALGGGWARHRISNIVGDKSTGKTLLAIEAAANFAHILPKGKIRYREAESAFDIPYAKALGMPTDRVDFGEPIETVEDLFEDLDKICKGAHEEELYILDSLDALSDREEMDREFDKGSYGAQKAKNMSKLFRMRVRKLAEKKITLIIISQIRDKMNAMAFGKKTVRSGGHALDFYASQVCYLTYTGRKTKTVSGIKRAYGVEVEAFIEKNKIALPFRKASFSIKFGYGIDDIEACLAWLGECGGLKELGIKSPKEHIRAIESMDDKDYKEEIAKIHRHVKTKWYEIETSFLPTRKKVIGD